nr:AMP-binding protein [Succinivibrionaceae bacterium]
MTQPDTLARALARHARATPGRPFLTFLPDGTTEGAQTLTFGEFHRAAGRVADALAALGPQEGARALLLIPPCPDFAIAFFGCLMAGVVAVPTVPPGLARMARTRSRLEETLRDSGASIFLTTAALHGV